MIVWFSYDQLFCTLLAKYLPFKSISGHSSLFGDVVPKGDVGGSNLQSQRQLLFSTHRCTVLQIGYYAGVTRALCTAYQQSWLVVVVLDSASQHKEGGSDIPTPLDNSSASPSTAHRIAVAVHRHAGAVYYVDVPPLPSEWRYARLVDTNMLSRPTTAGQPHHASQQQSDTFASEDDSIVEPCHTDIIDVITLLGTYALSCQILLFIPSIVERLAEHSKHAEQGNDGTKLTKLHVHNNNMLATISKLVDQRYAQLAAT